MSPNLPNLGFTGVRKDVSATELLEIESKLCVIFS